ncbi:MAG: glycosyltransferase [Candidatus Margulisbacteria bacterium]|nr:glycosyltransferase [Candidatus Margulisiibacteriota bacterium]
MRKIIAEKKLDVRLITFESGLDKTGGLGAFAGQISAALQRFTPTTVEVIAPLTPYIQKNYDLQPLADATSKVLRMLSNNFYWHESKYKKEIPQVLSLMTHNGVRHTFLGTTSQMQYNSDLPVRNQYSSNVNKYSAMKKNFLADLSVSNDLISSNYQCRLGRYTALSDGFINDVMLFNWLMTSYLLVSAGENQILHFNEWHTAFYPIIQHLIDYKDRDFRTIFTLHNIFNPDINDYSDFFGIRSSSLPLNRQNPLDTAFQEFNTLATVSRGFSQELSRFKSIPKTVKQFDVVLNGYDEMYDLQTVLPQDKVVTSENISAIKKDQKTKLFQELSLTNPERMLLSFIHRWDPQKGYLETLKVIDQFFLDNKFTDDIVLVMTCNSDDRDDVIIRNSLLEKYPDKIAIVDYSDTIAVKIFQASDLFLFPSPTHEPFGIQAVNSFASGTPVLAHKTGGLVDTINPGINGLLFDKTEADDNYLSAYRNKLEKMINLFKNGAWDLFNLYWNAYKSKEDFTWEKAAQGYYDIYNQVIN